MPIHTFTASDTDLATRLDQLLVRHYPDYTRNFFQKLLKDGCVKVQGKVAKASSTLILGQKVEVTIPLPRNLELEAREIPLNIVYEDKDLLVIDKPAGLVVHPGVGDSHIDDSLVNAVLYHCKGELSGISGVMRPGIVHRLDKDTSGLLLVAKNDKAHQSLADQLKKHEIQKIYYALVAGHLTPEKGSIVAPIGRSAADRKKMAVVQASKGREATTRYEVLQYFKTQNPVEPHFTYVRVHLITGRTHQIRVHFASIGFPLVGDPLYGREKLNNFFEQKYNLRRQFLHAGKITFTLPGTQKKATFEATLPKDLQVVLDRI